MNKAKLTNAEMWTITWKESQEDLKGNTNIFTANSSDEVKQAIWMSRNN